MFAFFTIIFCVLLCIGFFYLGTVFLIAWLYHELYGSRPIPYLSMFKAPDKYLGVIVDFAKLGKMLDDDLK